MGDFNVRIGAVSMAGSNSSARDGVINALKSNQMKVVTEGMLRPNGKNLIDHVAITPDLTVKSVDIKDHPRSDHPYISVMMDLDKE